MERNTDKVVRRRHRRSTAERVAELEALLAKRQEQEKMLADRIRELKFGRKAMTVAQLSKAIPQVKKAFSGHQITMETVLGMALFSLEALNKGQTSIDALSEAGKNSWRTTRAVHSAAIRKDNELKKKVTAPRKATTRTRKTA